MSPLLQVTTPILIILFGLPWIAPGGSENWLSQVLSMGLAFAGAALMVLFIIFFLIQPKGWSAGRGANLAEIITLWLAAGIIVANVF